MIIYATRKTRFQKALDKVRRSVVQWIRYHKLMNEKGK